MILEIMDSGFPSCQVEKGQAKRIPRNTIYGLVGFRIGCPFCGWHIYAMNKPDKNIITDSGGITTIIPLVCDGCKAEMEIKDCEVKRV